MPEKRYGWFTNGKCVSGRNIFSEEGVQKELEFLESELKYVVDFEKKIAEQYSSLYGKERIEFLPVDEQ